MDVTSWYTTRGGVEFKLIDTPGLDNMTMSDVDVWAKIAGYLVLP